MESAFERKVRERFLFIGAFLIGKREHEGK